MRHKPTEVTGVTAVVSREDFLAPEECAVAVLDYLAEKRAKDTAWGAFVCIPLGSGTTWIGRGPWATKHIATRDALKLAAAGPGPGSARVVQLKTEDL